MSSSSRIIIVSLVVFLVLVVVVCFTTATSTERNVGVCLRNCAQCRNMYGLYFKADKCADYCVKYKGKFIPDCEDENSISVFIQVPENDYY